MNNPAHKGGRDQYYTFFKTAFLPLIPDGPNVILDLGCGAGSMGRRLLELNKAGELIGAEIFKPASQEASKHYTKVYDGDVEQMDFPYKDYFDFVICGDILEHLKSPDVMMRRIRGWLKSDGKILCCVPNVRNYRVLLDLTIRGRWDYVEAGIMDQTHLRFFTRRSFLDLLTAAGFDIEHHEMLVEGRKKGLANHLTFGCFEEFLSSQMIVCARRNGDRPPNGYGRH
jgi:2-polyprenyl-3-methyl-5-hydroxy-6-metoxy-1,4-benzoquinol methylase